MIKRVLKRDGKKECYSFQKIEKAVSDAFKSCDLTASEKFIEQLNDEVDKLLEPVWNNGEIVSIEMIQDIIRNFLIKKNKYDVAEAFILYRDKRNRIREQKSKLVKGIREKLEARNIQNQNANVDEMSFGGRMGEANRVATKEMALYDCMTERSRNNHLNNEIYQHDLDSYFVGMHNCLSIPFDELLARGFNTRQTDVRPANSINTAFQLVAVIFQLQSLQQFGGVSATHIDWTMVPYVRKSFFKHYLEGLKYLKHIEGDLVDYFETDPENVSIDDPYYKTDDEVYTYAIDMTRKECHQAVEGMYHNLNTLQSRSGNQLPFTSINYGTCTLPEGRLVITELLEVSIEGLGKFGRTSIFPCGIFQCMKGVNRKSGDPNYDLFLLALKSTSQRIYPNYCNCDTTMNVIEVDRVMKEKVISDLTEASRAKLVEQVSKYPELAKELNLGVKDNKIVITREWSPKEIYSTMGCRTVNGLDINFIDFYKSNVKHLINDEIDKVNLSLISAFQKDGRGNICPVTLILPTLAMEAKQKYIKNNPLEEGCCYATNDFVDEFMKLFVKKLDEAKDSLIERFNWICKQPSDCAKFMYENHTMAGYIPEEGTSSALKHGTLTIGILGVEEACQILNCCNHYEGKGIEFTDNLIKVYSDKCKEYKEKYKLNFATYYTPAENLCHTALKNFKKKYGEIPNVSDREYFTNSIHVPVWADMDPFEKIDIESRWANKGAGGTITYVELPSTAKHNIEALETLVNYAMDKDIPYFAVNLPLDCCENCGYQDEIGETCPKCGSSNITRLRRVTGYLTGNYTTAFNKGKVQETEQRVKHIKG